MLTHEEQIHHLLSQALLEDIGSGDHSTLSCIPANVTGKAILKVKQEGLLAGVNIAKKILALKEPTAQIDIYMQDGQRMQNGDIAFEIVAKVHTILQCERLILNTMQRMSGIATLTAQYAAELKGFKTQLLDTRKTTPNFRVLEKEAVKIGGGVNHRMGLYDMIMLKDNHIDFCGGLETAIQNAYDYIQSNNLKLKIEVETRSLEDVQIVLSTGKVDRIMLDNFSPEILSKAIELINGSLETEASGGIHLENIQQYAATGVDYISVGALIHQAKSLDLSLKAVI